MNFRRVPRLELS